MLMLIILTEFVIGPEASPIVIWLILAVTIFIGVFAGFIAMKLPRIGIAAAGIWLGFLITLLMQNAFLYRLSTSNVPFYLVLVALCGLMAVAGWYYFDIVLISATSLFGVSDFHKPQGLFDRETHRLLFGELPFRASRELAHLLQRNRISAGIVLLLLARHHRVSTHWGSLPAPP
jgi:hypothetical protein